MKRLLFACLFVLLASTAIAQRYEIRPSFPTFPNRHHQNDWTQPGSYLNPYVIQDRQTGKTWEVRPEFPSFNRRGNDLMQPGAYLNPWVVEEK